MKKYVDPLAKQKIEGWVNAGLSIEDVNKLAYAEWASIPRRTVRAWTHAVRNETDTQDTPNKHFSALKRFTLFPEDLPRFKQSQERTNDIRNSKIDSGELVWLLNWQDCHVENSDPGIHELMHQIIAEFKPDYCTFWGDMVDNALLAEAMHGTRYFNAGVDLSGTPYHRFTDPIHAASQFFFDASESFATMIHDASPDTNLVACMGNHEAWLFRYLHENAPGVWADTHDKLMSFVDKHNIIWTFPDRIKEWRLTPNVLLVHGWITRSSYYGATARGYQKKYPNQCVIYGHNHRPEVIESDPDPFTEERTFYAGTGTTAEPLNNSYAGNRYLGHGREVHLIGIDPVAHKRHQVHKIRIRRENGWLVAEVFKERFQVKSHYANPYEQRFD